MNKTNFYKAKVSKNRFKNVYKVWNQFPSFFRPSENFQKAQVSKTDWKFSTKFGVNLHTCLQRMFTKHKSPKLIEKFLQGLESISKWLLRISTYPKSPKLVEKFLQSLESNFKRFREFLQNPSLQSRFESFLQNLESISKWS